jgi:hypothetical protein
VSKGAIKSLVPRDRSQAGHASQKAARCAEMCAAQKDRNTQPGASNEPAGCASSTRRNISRTIPNTSFGPAAPAATGGSRLEPIEAVQARGLIGLPRRGVACVARGYRTNPRCSQKRSCMLDSVPACRKSVPEPRTPLGRLGYWVSTPPRRSFLVRTRRRAARSTWRCRRAIWFPAEAASYGLCRPAVRTATPIA